MPSPIVTATVQATALGCVSNILAQFLDEYRHSQPFHLDLAQLIRFVVCTIITAPPNYHWQAFLERVLPARPGAGAQQDQDVELEDGLSKRHDGDDADNILASDPMAPTGQAFEREKQAKLSWRNTFLKWFIDCISIGAILNTLAFLIIMGVLKGKSVDGIGQSVRKETIPIIVAGYKIWPIASVISFTLIPVEKRIVFLSAVGLCWGVYLSLVAAAT